MTRKTERPKRRRSTEVLVESSNRDEWRKEFFLSQYATCQGTMMQDLSYIMNAAPLRIIEKT